MEFVGRSSIRKTFQLVLLIASGTALLMAVVGFSVSDWFLLRDQLQQQLRSEASIIASNSATALTQQDQAAAQRTLASLKHEPNVAAAALYNNREQLFARYEKASGYLPPTAKLQGTGNYRDLLYLQLPIQEASGQSLGSILILADRRNWYQQQFWRFFMAAALFALSLMWALFVSLGLQNLVTKPLLTLARTARQITQSRDYGVRAEVLSNDEIGRLASDFNAMLDEIQARDQNLKQAQEQLEEKVAERTLELQALARRLEHQAYHDALTGLANRITFDNRLRDALGQARRNATELAVIFLDLDRFKVINDSLGHGAGDRLLVEISERLKACLDGKGVLGKGTLGKGTLARLGGDEFAILLTSAGSNSYLSQLNSGLAHTQTHAKDPTKLAYTDVANNVLNVLSESLQINGQTLHVTASLGIAVYPGDGDTAASLLKNADAAMYRSKALGRNRVTYFSRDMNQHVKRRLLLENKLRTAIQDSQLTLFYQAKWSCVDGRLMGVEALLRWVDEDGEVSPEEFITLAEDCGLIADIDVWVLENACRDMLQLHREGFPDVQLSVNMSPLHFSHHDAYLDVSRLLTKTGFPAHKLELEITESLLGAGAEEVYEQLRSINSLGVQLAIDDFGKAYSSLSRLKQLPFNTLKIDRAFIRDLSVDEDDATLVKTIITMAHNLNLKVVAEGIETAQQYDFVVAHDCDVVQGHLFSKPVSYHDLLQLAQRSHQPISEP